MTDGGGLQKLMPRYSEGVRIQNWYEDQFGMDFFPPKNNRYYETNYKNDFKDISSASGPEERAQANKMRREQYVKQQGLEKKFLFDHHGGYKASLCTVYDRSFNTNVTVTDKTPQNILTPTAEAVRTDLTRNPEKLKKAIEKAKYPKPPVKLTSWNLAEKKKKQWEEDRVSEKTKWTTIQRDSYKDRPVPEGTVCKQFNANTQFQPSEGSKMGLRQGYHCYRSPLIDKPCTL
eukprot:Nk52_evm7s166 gene=Nk52_evmTU7s166